ncbi:MAG: protein kinase [Deltaproteobacteria bacterium]|nr:protein kinase [Deltaproteobacteria bacterium]
MARIWSGSGIGPYRFEGKLGSGASGVVYRAVDAAGRRAAVKVLHGHVEDPAMRERFRREAQLAIDHPNVVKILGAGFGDGDVPYIAFELLDGESLEQHLARRRPMPLEVVRLGRQACAGLAAAHAKGVVHRDLKPANLFLTRDGTLKLLDFGVALATARTTRLTQAEAIMGTPAYLSPEQARGLRDLDARTDVWALGAILYEALSGRIPFARDTVFATLVAIRKDEVPPLASLVPGLPPGLVSAIERALVKDRAGRWASVTELDAALAPIDAKPRSRQTIVPDADPFASAETRVLAMLLAHEVLDQQALRAAIELHGGRMMALRGDRVLGLFGLEAWVGDEVSRAVRAGLEARAAAGPIAVAAGQATMGGDRIGGPVLDAVKRGCQAGLSGLAIDAASARGLEGHVSLRAHADGLLEVVSRRVSTQLAHSSRAMVELVGRQAELGLARAALEAAARDRHAVALVVCGPAGIGKSRLCQEVERVARALRPAFTIFVGHGARHRQSHALALVRALVLHQLRRGLRADGPSFDELSMAARREAVGALVDAVAGGAMDVGACVEALCVLLDVEVAPSVTLQAARRDPNLMLERLRQGVLAYFEGALACGPIALFVEELQWVDEASLDLIEELLVRHAASPLFILTTSREAVLERRPLLFSAGNVKRIELGGLSAADVSRLVQLTLGRRLPEAALRQLTQHTTGNPLFVEQIVGALDEAQIAASEGGALPLPLSVRAAVQSRLDQLEPGEKELGKAAAIFDRAFFADELAALGLSEATATLAALLSKGVLAQRGRAHPRRGPSFRFQSQLMAEVAYGMLTPEARKRLHQRLAEHLARAPEAPAEEVARHYELGGNTGLAARHYHAACLSAARVGDARRALACADKALALGVAPEARFALHIARADALRLEGRREQHAAALVDALATANDEAERARALRDEAWRMLDAGRLERAAEVAGAAERAARAAGDDEGLALALGCGVIVCARLGALGAAEAAFREAAALAAAAGPDVRAQVAMWRAQLADARHEPSERLDALRDALALYREVGDAARAAAVSVDLAELHGRSGRYEIAADELQVAIDDCRQVVNRSAEGRAWAHLAHALGMMRRTSEAWNALEEGLQLARAQDDARLELRCTVLHVMLLARDGDPDELCALADDAAEEAARLGEPGLEALALALSARARLRAGALDLALDRAQQAMAIRDARDGVEDDEALVFLALAEAYAANDLGSAAEDVRAAGLARIRELATRISDPDQRADYEAHGPWHRELTGEPDGP